MFNGVTYHLVQTETNDDIVKKRVIVDACRLHYKSIGCPTLNHLVLSVS